MTDDEAKSEMYFQARLTLLDQPDARLAIRDTPFGGFAIELHRPGRLPMNHLIAGEVVTDSGRRAIYGRAAVALEVVRSANVPVLTAIAEGLRREYLAVLDDHTTAQ